MIEAAISKRDTFDDFNFIIDAFNGTISIGSSESIVDIRSVGFKGLEGSLKLRRNKWMVCFE